MQENMLRVLLIEDEQVDAMHVRRCLHALSTEEQNYTLEHSTTLGEGLERLSKKESDVLLLDLNLPDALDTGTVAQARERDPDVPLVVLTGQDDDAIALRALDEGAQDYLVKSEVTPSLLRRALRYAIERKRLQQEAQKLQDHLRQAQRLESLAVFAAGLGWGLNHHLGSIFEEVDQLLADLAQLPGQAGSLKARGIVIRKSAQQAADLVAQIRSFAGNERLNFRVIALSSLVAEVTDTLETMAAGRARLSFDLPGNLPAVLADTAHLRQVLVNLVVNACEATRDPKAPVSIATGRRRVDREFLMQHCAGTDLAEGEYVFLSVRGSGRPLEGEALERAFEPFFTNKRAGRGLGMAAALGIVRDHGGAIKLESGDGWESAVTVLLPPTSS